MSNVINLADRKIVVKQPGSGAPPPHEFSIHVYGHGGPKFDTEIEGPAVKGYETRGERLRSIASRLESLARMLYDEAEEVDPQNGKTVAVLTVYAAPATSLWLTGEVESKADVDWIADMFDGAKSMIRTTAEALPAG